MHCSYYSFKFLCSNSLCIIDQQHFTALQLQSENISFKAKFNFIINPKYGDYIYVRLTN